MVIGYFGSIYKGKDAAALLDVCGHLRTRGIRALIVFAGSFTHSLDGYEQQFRSKVREFGLDEQVIVTGYIPTKRNSSRCSSESASSCSCSPRA